MRENVREMFLSSRRKKEMEIEKRAALFACLLAVSFASFARLHF